MSFFVCVAVGGHSHSQKAGGLVFREVKVPVSSHAAAGRVRRPQSSPDLNSLPGCPAGEVGGAKNKK